MSIGAELLRFSDRKVVIFDAETQRVNTMQDNLPFQWAHAITQKGRVLSTCNRYLKWPGFKMSPDAARITRFQQSWVDDGEDPRAVLAEWEKVSIRNSNLNEFPDDGSDNSEERVRAFEFAKAAALALE